MPPPAAAAPCAPPGSDMAGLWCSVNRCRTGLIREHVNCAHGYLGGASVADWCCVMDGVFFESSELSRSTLHLFI